MGFIVIKSQSLKSGFELIVAEHSTKYSFLRDILNDRYKYKQ